MLRVAADAPSTNLLGDVPQADLISCAPGGAAAAISTGPRLAKVVTLPHAQRLALVQVMGGDISGLVLAHDVL